MKVRRGLRKSRPKRSLCVSGNNRKLRTSTFLFTGYPIRGTFSRVAKPTAGGEAPRICRLRRIPGRCSLPAKRLPTIDANDPTSGYSRTSARKQRVTLGRAVIFASLARGWKYNCGEGGGGGERSRSPFVAVNSPRVKLSAVRFCCGSADAHARA